MAKTVGMTTAITTRLVLEGRVKQRGVISCTDKEIYEPSLKELEKHGIIMVEESERFTRHKL